MKNGIPLIQTGDAGLVQRGFILGSKIGANVVEVFTVEELEYHEAHLPEIRTGLARYANRASGRTTSEKEMVASWEAFFRNGYNLKTDFSGAKIPKKRAGFDYLVAVPIITMNRIYEVSSAPGQIPSWRYTEDLDKSITVNDRDPNVCGPYFVWVRGGVEPDEELKNQSADMLKESKTLTVTTREQMLFRHKYFLDTGVHVDQKKWTLHGGSRNSGGNVPNSNWYDSQAKLNWYYTNNRNENLCGREEVSHQRSLYGSFGVREASQLLFSLEILIICSEILR